MKRERSLSPLDATKENENLDDITDPLSLFDLMYFQMSLEFVNCKPGDKATPPGSKDTQLDNLIQQIQMLRPEQKQSFQDFFAKIERRFEEQDSKIEQIDNKTEGFKKDVSLAQDEMRYIINQMSYEFAEIVYLHDVIEYQNQIEKNKNTLMFSIVADLEAAEAALNLIAPDQELLKNATIEGFCKGQRPQKIVRNKTTEETPVEVTNDLDKGEETEANLNQGDTGNVTRKQANKVVAYKEQIKHLRI